MQLKSLTDDNVAHCWALELPSQIAAGKSTILHIRD
jgi:hypothetical protein